MDKQELEKYRSKLCEEKNGINAEIEAFQKNFLDESQIEATGELSVVDNHPGDMGTEMFDRERNQALYQNEKHLLTKVEQALEKIDHGDYGKCEICGEEIGKDRLDFMPSASACINCEKQKQDYLTDKYDRPVEEETLAPYGRYFSDHNNKNLSSPGLKAEDIWQQVDRMNYRKGDELEYEEENDDPDSIIGTTQEPGIVELTDRISNQYYKKQLP